jgi:hypothetical protein
MPNNNSPAPATRARLEPPKRASPAQQPNPGATPKQRRQRNQKRQEPAVRDSSPPRSADSEPTPQRRRNKRSPQSNSLPSEIQSEEYHTQTNLQSLGYPTVAATPSKRSTAYAGPTFHASPAASSLPIPKLFTRSAQRPRSQVESSSSSDTGSSPISSPPSPTPVSPSRGPVEAPRQESNLDFLFRVDREERARKNGQNPTSPLSSPPFPAIPPVHHKHASHGSIDAVSRIELDGTPQGPAVAPPNLRSTTAPSRIPQGGATESERIAVQALLKTITSQPATTPPRGLHSIPSAPASRDHSPSPFFDGRLASSGPSTPAPPANSDPALFYGNRNLSPLFKAAKGDSPRPNSGLRTEVSTEPLPATRPGFQWTPQGVISQHSHNNYGRNNYNNYPEYRRSSVSHFEPGNTQYNASTRPPAQPFSSRPKSYSPADPLKMFMPSSVQAKLRSPPPVDTSSLENDIKRMLNINPVPGDIPVAQ